MSGTNGVGPRDTIYRNWLALREQVDRVMAENAHVCEAARQLRADAAEARVRSQADGRRRDEATMGRAQ